MKSEDSARRLRWLLAAAALSFAAPAMAQHTFKCGSGFWIAPHYWFIPGLSRDTQEEELNLAEGTVLSGIIGPPYHRLLPRPVRHHAYQMLRALTPEQRAAKVASLSRMTRGLAVAGIQREFPEASADELRVRLAVRLYGRDVARKLYHRVPDNAR